MGMPVVMERSEPWGIGHNPRAEGVQRRCWVRRGSERLVGMLTQEDQTFHCADGVVDVESVEAEVVFEELGDLPQAELVVAATQVLR